ncbi:3-ketoacyl-ACP reductase [Jiulongibacter sediminis]|uniref:3-ketoacyl-ACP reductase n=1 Tax=Jiulongibacter sediminis TaxID=1605367 RepID=A0A0P7BEW3_9BACT|nr:3-ketoacyl-ACP reductase [Jiulongibacter sediminis]KPM49353.1 3-ketoacyl-ACP reductase [Jiulongibacter sediminis]TBX26403.1 3-ketoacyl-ACP reductase [Jiulongibacter sediminis]
MKNKVALVTGGSRGIGFGIATELAKVGFDLTINGVRDEESAQEALNSLQSHGTKVTYAQGNIAKAEDRTAIIEKVLADHGRLNVLVNNAGVAPKVRKDMLEIEEEDFDYMMNINQKGTFFLTQKAAKELIKQKEGNDDFEAMIINITSISARTASTQRIEYCMAKASLSIMSSSFAVKMADYGIPVYEVQPGVIETDMTTVVKDKYTKMAEDGLVLEKRMGKPADIGKVVASLATGGLPYCTGQIIVPDGGLGIMRL